MDKIKICYIISNVDRAIAFEWIAANLEKEKFELSFILLNPGSSALEKFLTENNVHFTRITYKGKKHFVHSFWKTIKFLWQLKPHLIHCHLFDAALIGLLAGQLLGIKKRVYTRHHSTYNWQYNRKGILLDKFINALATDLVAISENTQNILMEKEKVNPSKIHLIHHGFDLDAFQKVSQENVKRVKVKYEIIGKPVIGVIARWMEWKGIQYIIPAFERLLPQYPQAALLLANTGGPYENHIRRLLKKLPEANYRIIDFEPDLFALYHLFDIYVHAPIDREIEAFGQTYVEALAASVPSVFTLSGVAPEFVKQEKNALIVPFKNSEAIFHAITRILKDQGLALALTKNGRKSVQQFELGAMISKLEALYQND